MRSGKRWFGVSDYHVLVCVTRQKTCERLIQAGADLARQHGGIVSVVHVAEKGADFLGIAKEAEAIEYLYHAAKAVDAEMTVLRAKNALDTLVAFAQEQKVQAVVTGLSMGKGGADFAQALRLRLPQVEVHTVLSHE